MFRRRLLIISYTQNVTFKFFVLTFNGEMPPLNHNNNNDKIRFKSKGIGIFIKRTPDTKRTSLLDEHGFTVNLSQRNFYKADIYKAENYKTDTFFVQQMKIFPKTALCKAYTGCRKTIFIKELYI